MVVRCFGAQTRRVMAIVGAVSPAWASRSAHQVSPLRLLGRAGICLSPKRQRTDRPVALEALKLGIVARPSN